MSLACTPPASPLLNEHFALCRAYAEAQQRCSRHMAAQQAEVARLQAQVLRLCAQALLLTTALEWERAAQRGAAVLPQWPCAAPATAFTGAAAAAAGGMEGAADAVAGEDLWPDGTPCRHRPLHSSLAQANLVLCRVGCPGQGAVWRDADDQCRRTGQVCVVVASARALRASAALPAPAGPLL